MGTNRVFLPQDALDRWLSEQRVEVEGETMTMKPEGRRFILRSAVRFLAEVTEAGDPHRLVGKVKDLEQVVGLGGEHCADSVILGDEAYQVIEGFVGEPLFDEAAAATGATLAGATRAAVGDEPTSGEIDLLARFFLSSR